MSSAHEEYIRLIIRGIRTKLGRAWFTRQLPGRTRNSRERQLTKVERQAAQVLRWVRA
jgi:hypothetical protein